MKKKKSLKEQKSKGALSRAAAVAFPRLTLECVEKYELLICGATKIAFYSPAETVVCTMGGKVRVTGAKLCIAFMGDGKIMISGVISAIGFI